MYHAQSFLSFATNVIFFVTQVKIQKSVSLAYPVLSGGCGHHGPVGPAVVDVLDGVGGRGRHLHPFHPEAAEADQGIVAVDGETAWALNMNTVVT